MTTTSRRTLPYELSIVGDARSEATGRPIRIRRQHATYEDAEEYARELLGCVEQGEPRRRVLVKMSIEPDGAVSDVTLLGADQLAEKGRHCIRTRVMAMHAPKEELRGQETLLVHLSL